MWIVALTLNESIGALKTINATISKPLWRNYKQMRIMKKSVFNVKFEGITVSEVHIWTMRTSVV